MKELTEAQLEESVLKLPSLIREKEKEVSSKLEARDRKKLEVEVAKSVSIISSKAESLTDTLCKARAERDTETKQAELIKAEGELKLAQAEMNELLNKFDAVRSAIKIRTATISSGLGGN